MPEPDSDYIAALRRAFVERRADYVALTSRREQFQAEAMNFGMDRGWLRGQWDTRDPQSTAFICRLTEEGKRYFNL